MSTCNITLAGSIGSGKSTVGRMLAAALKSEFISTGMIFRSIGKNSKMTPLQTNLAAEINTAIDHQVDNGIIERAKSSKPFVMDSRMAWHFVPDSLKVYLYASPQLSAQRVFSDTSHARANEQFASVTETRKSIQVRRESEIARYYSLYGVKIDDITNYDLFIVSDGAEPNEIVDVILESLPNKSQDSWIKTKQLVPLISAKELHSIPRRVDHDDTAHNPLAIQLVNGYGFVLDTPYHLAKVLMKGDQFTTFEHSRCPQSELRQTFLDLTSQKEINPFHEWEELTGTKLAISNEDMKSLDRYCIHLL